MDFDDAKKEGEKIPEGNSMEKEQYVFSVDYRDETGLFTNKILNHDDKNQAAATAARLRGGLPYESIEPMRRHIQDCMGWLGESLVDTPKWYRLGKMIDDRLIYDLWEVVQKHERIFRGQEEDQAGDTQAG